MVTMHADVTKALEKDRMAKKVETQRAIALYYRNFDKYPEAVRWWKKAAKQGDTQAMFFLGIVYQQGRDGLLVDIKQSIKYFTDAAAKGEVGAMLSLGQIYSWGKGIPKNRSMTIKWYKKVVSSGQKTTADYRTAVYQLKKLDPQYKEPGAPEKTAEEIAYKECSTKANNRITSCSTSENYSQFTGGIANSNVSCDFSPPPFTYNRCKNAVANANSGKYYCDIETGYFNSNKQQV